METLLYLAKINLFLVLFYASYWLLFRNHTFFKWNRFYLLGGLILSATLPAIKFTETYRVEISSSLNDNQVSKVVAISSQAAEQGSDWAMIGFGIYLAGTALMMSVLLASFYRLFKTIKQSERIETARYTLILLDQKDDNVSRGSFSFFNWLVIAREDYEHNPDVILRHEYVHISQLHSIDILLIELFKVFFWVNPVVWFYKNAMQATHEFLADQEVSDREQYANFLVSYALNSQKSLITNHFFNSSLLKSRIQMIYKNRTSRWLLGKYALIVPIIVLTVFLTAARERVAEPASAAQLFEKPGGPAFAQMNAETAAQEETIDINGTVIDENGQSVPDAIIVLAGSKRGIATDKGGKFEFKELPLDGRLVVTHVNFKSAEVFIDKNKTSYAITLHKNADIISGGEITRSKPATFMNYQVGKIASAAPANYTISEQKPQFPGGHEAMIGYLRENIKYPAPALKANVEGVVLVQFTVNEDGALGDIVIVKGVGFGLDGESIRLVKQMPKWEPAIQNGKAIKAKQSIEIKFNLEEAKSKKSQGYNWNDKQPEQFLTMDDLGKRFNKFLDFSTLEQVQKPVKSDTAKTYFTNYRYAPYKITTPGFVAIPANPYKFRIGKP